MRYAIWYGQLFDGVTANESYAREARERGAVVIRARPGDTPADCWRRGPTAATALSPTEPTPTSSEDE